MIIENELEAKALAYVLDLASELTSNRGCNDLESKDVEDFKMMVVQREDGLEKFDDKAKYDFDIVDYIRKELEANGYKE